MKLNKQELDFIQSVIKTIQLVDIENIIIEPGKVRAMDENQSIVVFQDTNIPKMSFGSLGLNRIKVFQTRLELAQSQDNFEIEVTTNGEDDEIGYDKYDVSSKDPQPMWARSFCMSGKNVKLDYRCASPQTIKAPKQRAGISKYVFNIVPEVITMMQKGKIAMKSDEVTFIGDNKGVNLVISDINGDALNYHFTDEYEVLDGSSSNFSYKYSIDQLLPLFKTNTSGVCSLTARGSLMFTVNSLDVYVMARG